MEPGSAAVPGASICGFAPFLRAGLCVLLGAAGALPCAAAPAKAAPAPGPLYWCDATDPARLDLVVTRRGERYFMTNVARYAPADRNCYWFVNWDLLGTWQRGRPVQDVEVEAGSLYLVHLYEVSKSKNLRDFWAKDPLKSAASACVWVGGSPAARRAPAGEGVNGVLEEVRESPAWFHYAKGDRLPIFARQFPEFRLPPGKVLCVNRFRTQDRFDSCRRRGVTHFPDGGPDLEKLPRSQRLSTIGSFFNRGIGSKASDDPHISPTERAFIDSPPSHAVSKASLGARYDYIFLDEEFWHSDYHPATIERLCLFARAARQINPTLKLADFWNPPPYTFSFHNHRDRWSADSVRTEVMRHYDRLNDAMKSVNSTLLRKVEVDGKPTCLAEELTAVSQCVYFDNLFGYIDEYKTFSNDFFIPAAIHSTRMNRRMPCNRGKPIIWFGMDILEGKYHHPRIAYPTRTHHPPGLAIFHDRLLVSPNFNEAIGLFGLLEADGAYLWDAHGLSDGDPDGIFRTLTYCRDYKDDRGEWRPDAPGTPIGKGATWYPYAMAYAADYYVLGAWKYSRIADVVTRGKRVDFEYSTDGGATWYVPPANGGTMADVVHDGRPIVSGAVAGKQLALVAFHPYQGVADTTSLRVRYEGTTFAVELFGTRVHVYKGSLAR